MILRALILILMVVVSWHPSEAHALSMIEVNTWLGRNVTYRECANTGSPNTNQLRQDFESAVRRGLGTLNHINPRLINDRFRRFRNRAMIVTCELSGGTSGADMGTRRLANRFGRIQVYHYVRAGRVISQNPAGSSEILMALFHEFLHVIEFDNQTAHNDGGFLYARAYGFTGLERDAVYACASAGIGSFDANWGNNPNLTYFGALRPEAALLTCTNTRVVNGAVTPPDFARLSL